MAWVIEPSLAVPRHAIGECIRCGEKNRIGEPPYKSSMYPGMVHACYACGFVWHITAEWAPTLAETMVDLSGDCEVIAGKNVPDHQCGGSMYRELGSIRVRTDHGLVFKLQCTSCGGVRQVILSE